MADHLQGLIADACKASGPDPALNREICVLINEKQGSFPRVAAVGIVRYVNSKNKAEALLALTLLDLCVKKCGYPFQLQIASKEFLNALVQMFPATARRSKTTDWAHFDSVIHGYAGEDPVMERILYMIREWKIALVDRLGYRDDFANINSMYRLLRQRGYQFPEIRESSISALTSNSVLRTPEELEEQDRVRLSAKLQEHIRRGTKEDLKLADVIMKLLTGYEQRDKPDYKQKFADQIRGIRSKAIVLYELLESMRPGESIDRSIKDLHFVCEQAHEKVKEVIENESTDEIDAVIPLSSLLDKVLSKYSDVEKGNFDTQYDIQALTSTQTATSPPPTSSTPTPPVDNLIDLDDDDTSGHIRLDTDSPSSSTTHDSPWVSPTTTAINTISPSTPPAGQEQDTYLIHDKNGLKVHLQIYERVVSLIKLRFFFSNESTAPMEQLELQVATPKSMQIKMGSLSGSMIPAKSTRAVYQWVAVNNPQQEQLRLRFRLMYDQFGTKMEQAGQYNVINANDISDA
ncbi:hypothetical protein K492DRAFT_237568 [Lichtheimia hyalospora FSU 10163]|nr:hypothetical protein K492DRAFT_237568 [Lichtheimia hyalospora FSU 10163]